MKSDKHGKETQNGVLRPAATASPVSFSEMQALRPYPRPFTWTVGPSSQILKTDKSVKWNTTIAISCNYIKSDHLPSKWLQRHPPRKKVLGGTSGMSHKAQVANPLPCLYCSSFSKFSAMKRKPLKKVMDTFWGSQSRGNSHKTCSFCTGNDGSWQPLPAPKLRKPFVTIIIIFFFSTARFLPDHGF